MVTGGGSGIGRAIANALASEGVKVVIPDINFNGALETTKQITEAGGYALPLDVNITITKDIKKLVDKTLESYDKIDILVNNAGVNLPAPFLEMPMEKWNKTIDVNLTGVFLCSQLVARQMVKQATGGKIINIASIAARIAYPGSIAYTVTKSGVVALTRTMAVELAPHKINVNSIAPGTTATPMTKKALASEEAYKAEIARIPLRRLAEPEEIAKLVVFLASKDSDYITGETIVIDGGWLTG